MNSSLNGKVNSTNSVTLSGRTRTVIVTSVSSMTQTLHLRPLRPIVGIVPDITRIVHLNPWPVTRRLNLHLSETIRSLFRAMKGANRSCDQDARCPTFKMGPCCSWLLDSTAISHPLSDQEQKPLLALVHSGKKFSEDFQLPRLLATRSPLRGLWEGHSRLLWWFIAFVEQAVEWDFQRPRIFLKSLDRANRVTRIVSQEPRTTCQTGPVAAERASA